MFFLHNSIHFLSNPFLILGFVICILTEVPFICFYINKIRISAVIKTLDATS